MIDYAKHGLALVATLFLGFYLGGYWVINSVKANAEMLFQPVWVSTVNNVLAIALVCGLCAVGLWIGIDYDQHKESESH